MTQRAHPRLALVTTSLGASTLTLGVPGGGSVDVALAPIGRRRTVRCWHDDVEAVEVEGAAAELVSAHLGEACTLVFMPDDVVRPVEAPHGAPGDRVGFADAYPVLLASRASLADLNERLRGAPRSGPPGRGGAPSNVTEPMPMNRFRPNLVVEGGAPFEEEEHASVRVGRVSFRMPKRCSRCQVTTVDQATATVGKEPLRTLATYRTTDNKVYFAQNLIPDALDASASIAIGDEIVYSGRLAT